MIISQTATLFCVVLCIFSAVFIDNCQILLIPVVASIWNIQIELIVSVVASIWIIQIELIVFVVASVWIIQSEFSLLVARWRCSERLDYRHNHYGGIPSCVEGTYRNCVRKIYTLEFDNRVHSCRRKEVSGSNTHCRALTTCDYTSDTLPPSLYI